MKKLWFALVMLMVLLLCVTTAQAVPLSINTANGYTVSISSLTCPGGHWLSDEDVLGYSAIVASTEQVNIVNAIGSLTYTCDHADCSSAEYVFDFDERIVNGRQCHKMFAGGISARESELEKCYVTVNGPSHDHMWSGWWESGAGHMRKCNAVYCGLTETGDHVFDPSHHPKCGETQTCTLCDAEIPYPHNYKFYITQHPSTPDEEFKVRGTCQNDACRARDIELTGDTYTVLHEVYRPCVAGYGFGTLTYRVTFTHEGQPKSFETTIQTGDQAPGSHAKVYNGDGAHSCSNPQCPAKDIDLTCTPGEKATCTTPQICTVCNGTLVNALNHEPGAAATCTTAQTCNRCPHVIQEALQHSPGAAATCLTAQTCIRCPYVYVDALGHEPGAAATCTVAQTCIRCPYVYVDALGHEPGAAATCLTAQTCIRCPYVYVDALGHEPGAAATCTAAQTCIRCPYVFTAALNHNYVYVPGAAPTCTEPGLSPGTACSRCGDVQYEQVYLLPKGHTLAADAPIAPTCTEPGLTAGEYCTVCGAILLAQETVPALGHAPVTDPAVEATCQQPGLTEGSHCEVCSLVFIAQRPTAKKPHWFRNWTPNGAEGHTGHCACGAPRTVNCQLREVPMGDATVPVCLICGRFGDAVLPLVNADDMPSNPNGTLVVRAQTAPFERALALLTIAYESAGNLIAPRGQVEAAFKLDIAGGFTIIRADGAEVDYTWMDGFLTIRTDEAAAFLVLAK